MSTGKKVSLFVILSIILIIYFFGYNYDYNNNYWISITFLLLLLFSYIVLTSSIYEKIVGENPGSFFLYPWKKVKYVFLSAVLIVSLGVLVFSTLFLSLELAVQRKNKILSSSETSKMNGVISKVDSIPYKYGKVPVAYLNYKVENENFEFELRNENQKYKVNQNIQVKYSLKHPDMFEIIK